MLALRRWLNGSFFAAIHSIVHFGYLYRSSWVDFDVISHFFWSLQSHTFTRKFFLHIELVYRKLTMKATTYEKKNRWQYISETLNMIFAWFALGNYFIAFVCDCFLQLHPYQLIHLLVVRSYRISQLPRLCVEICQYNLALYLYCTLAMVFPIKFR